MNDGFSDTSQTFETAPIDTRLRREDFPGFIYWLGSWDEAEPIKIGFASNVHERRGKIQTSHWVDLVVYGFVPGDKRVEKRIHGYLKNYRVRGEWFDREVALDLLDDFQLHWVFQTDRLSCPERSAGE